MRGKGKPLLKKDFSPFPRPPILFPKTCISRRLITNIPSLPEPVLNDARSPIMPRIHRIFPKIFSGIKKPPPESGRRLFLCHDRQFLIQIPLQTPPPVAAKRNISRQRQTRTVAHTCTGSGAEQRLPSLSAFSKHGFPCPHVPAAWRRYRCNKGRGGNYSLRPAFPVLTG